MDFTVESNGADLRVALNNQRKQNSFCDVTLSVNGESLPAHRCILAASSDYFRRLFLKTKEAYIPNYSLPAASTDAYRLVLEYFYMGSIHIALDNVEEILRVAEAFDVRDVKSFCSDILRRYLDVANCIHVKSLIDQFKLQDIRQDVVDFLSPRMTVLVAGNQLLHTPFPEVFSLVSDPELSHVNEVNLFLFISRWLKDDPEDRKQYLERLVSVINFSYLSPEFIKRHVINTPIMDVLSHDQRKSVELRSSEVCYPSRYEDVLFCVGRDESEQRLLVYKIADDAWYSLGSCPSDLLDGHVQSMVSHQGSLYMIQQPIAASENSSQVYKLDMERGVWSQPTAPSHLTEQSRLISHGHGLYILDGSGVLDKYNNMSEAWVSYSGPTFENASSTAYTIAIPVERYIYFLRAYCKASSFRVDLHRYDLHKYTWDVTCPINPADYNEHERFHCYEVTTSGLLLKDILGFPMLKYSFRSRQCCHLKSSQSLPIFVRDIYVSVQCSDRVYFTGRDTNNHGTFMFYDHCQQRFKSVTSPGANITEAICHSVAPRALEKIMRIN